MRVADVKKITADERVMMSAVSTVHRMALGDALFESTHHSAMLAALANDATHPLALFLSAPLR